MFLPFRQGMRFFRLFDLVSIYAHRRLHVASNEAFFNGDPPRGIGEQAQVDTCEELWKHPEVLVDYVMLNPDQLGKEDLETVASWRNSYRDIFSVQRLPQGSRNDLAFVSQGYAFVVSGLSREITALLRDIPTFVETTLLPFEDRIVYAMFMQQFPIALGEGIREQLSQELESAVAEGRVIRTGKEFLEAAPKAQKRREEHEIEKFRHDIEMEERAAGPLPGQHRGALAGIGKEERAQAIRDHTKKTAQGLFDPQERLSGWCEPGEAVTSLEELAALYDEPDDVEDAMRALTDEETLFEVLCHRGELGITSLRALAKAGGRMHVDPQGLDSLKNLPYPEHGLCHYFRDGDGYVVVMANEILETARKIDWDAALDYCRKLKELRAFFEAIVDLRGMVPEEEALEEYHVVCPDGIWPAWRARDELYEAAIFDEASMYMLNVDGQVYLVHFELMWEWFDEQGMDYRESAAYVEGDLGELLEGLLRQQRGKDPRPVLREMVDAESLCDWKEEQPPTIAMRDFLDEHVPDECDDYFFADKVIEDLIDELRWGMVKEGVRAFFDILANNGFEPDESQLNQLINLWMNMCNGLPNWPNNGWTPNELVQRTSTKRMFFNPDGSVKKIGRNDPCPCGSGKKYKRCCGR